MKSSGLGGLVLLALLLFAGPAAGETAAERGAQMKRQAIERMQERRYEEALDLYSRAYELSGDPALLYNLARAHEALGAYPEAVDKLESFKRVAPEALRAKVPDLDGLIVEISARVSRLIVRCAVSASRVTVREKWIADGCDPKGTLLRPGTATLEVSAEGFETERRTVELVAGEVLIVEALLNVARAMSALNVETTPRGSLVFLGGRPLGPSPVQASVTPGRHRLVVRQEGYVDAEIDLWLQGGQRRDVTVPLKSKPAVTSQWWFWTAIGTAVAGGVVAGIALTTTKDAPEGSFSPGQVRGP